MKHLYIIQPLEQRVIWNESYGSGPEEWVLDELTDELTHDCEILRGEVGQPLPMFVQRVINLDLSRPSRWTIVKGDNSEGWGHLWPAAMYELSKGRAYTLREIMTGKFTTSV